MRINFILFIASSFEGRGHKNIQQVAPTFPYFLASFLSNQTNRSLFYDLPPHLKSVKKGSDLLPFSDSSSCVSIDIYHKLTLSCEQAHTLAQGPADSEVPIHVNI